MMKVLFYNRRGDEKKIINIQQSNYHRVIVVINNKKMAKEIKNPPNCCKCIHNEENQEIEQLKELVYFGKVEYVDTTNDQLSSLSTILLKKIMEKPDDVHSTIIIDLKNANPVESYEVCKLSGVLDVVATYEDIVLEPFPKMIHLTKSEMATLHELIKERHLCSKQLEQVMIDQKKSTVAKAIKDLNDKRLIEKTDEKSYYNNREIAYYAITGEGMFHYRRNLKL